MSMKKYIPGLIFFITVLISFSFKESTNSYQATYFSKLDSFKAAQQMLLNKIASANLNSAKDVEAVRTYIQQARNKLKAVDLWLRYLEPTVYKKVNGPLPVEWETEVFEKFEKPYKREGAGLTLAALYLNGEHINKDSLSNFIKASLAATDTYYGDSITKQLNTPDHFFFCNRLFLLNLAAIYTTGFECTDTAHIIPELRLMVTEVSNIYRSFNENFRNAALTDNYIALYQQMEAFVNEQPANYSTFDHFSFIKDYINPLFRLNQQMINRYHVATHSLVDYSINKEEITIFNKALYRGQNPKGIFHRVDDKEGIDEIQHLGKLLFYDPILSGNNLRSCASCHKSGEYFTDTIGFASLQFDQKTFLTRNTPSLINAQYNHLIMLDGKHFSLQNQTKAVITNPIELGCEEKEILRKVLSCKEYRDGFEKLLKYTPQETEITFDHIVSAITCFYGKFSKYYAPFDEAINGNTTIEASAQHGFNIFMSKAQCGTCHFVPQFNGVKPPYVSSEFEVLGVPDDTNFKKLSNDKGRYEINPSSETLNAFRTGTIRNAERTKPYMHNGVFRTLEQVVDFYNAGGGIGKGLKVNNQTLSSDSLKLSKTEKADLIAFIKSLNEKIEFETPPEKLSVSRIKTLNNRKIGGVY
jgi:cytochrome c peroxidase